MGPCDGGASRGSETSLTPALSFQMGNRVGSAWRSLCWGLIIGGVRKGMLRGAIGPGGPGNPVRVLLGDKRVQSAGLSSDPCIPWISLQSDCGVSAPWASCSNRCGHDPRALPGSPALPSSGRPALPSPAALGALNVPVVPHLHTVPLFSSSLPPFPLV